LASDRYTGSPVIIDASCFINITPENNDFNHMEKSRMILQILQILQKEKNKSRHPVANMVN